uniref:AAT11 n=1 Tax=Sinonovacula rivularis TaxID=489091 RepID=A0AA49X901_9BIVA|nr:AAT11 [Sinonovacula rivularis]
MVEKLFWEDYLTIGIYFALVLALGLWSTCRPNKGSAAGYFLAGKNMHWIPIGASIYASNIGAPMFIGLAGTAAANGFSVTIYEWHAIYFLIALGWVFVPVYVACGAYTMPEYLRMRFGGRRIRLYASCLALVEYVLHNISAEIYSGAIFMQQLLGWNMYLCVALILAVTAVYTITGGLTSVIYTDTLQAVILIAGGVFVTSMSFSDIGGWDGLVTKYPYAASNHTLYHNVSCGVPRRDAFHIWRSPVTGDIPWPGAVFGLTTLGLFTWCQDQIIVQRCLSAKNLGHAKAGSLLAAFLKLFGFLLFVIPGMISRIKFPEEIACADPESCENFCQNKAGCSNLAYPLLVLRLLPSGYRGLMLAALLAALMSSLTSIFNSASSIVTLDIWRQFRKKATEAELMVVGRVTILVLIGVSILWLPILQQSQGGILWFYLQAVKSYLIVPWCQLFLLGFFWKRLTEQGAFWGLMVGLVVGLIRMGLDFAIAAPACGSGEPDTRFPVVAKVDFLHFAIILAAVSTIAMVVISLFTKPREEKQLYRVTWSTRHAIPEPELTDEEGDDPKSAEISSATMGIEDPPSYSASSQCSRNMKSWLCGIGDAPEKYISPEEKAEIRRKMTSITHNAKWGKVLNVLAVILGTVTAFFLGYFG